MFMPLIYHSFILIYFLLLPSYHLAQQKFLFPIDTIDITGNFGEIRKKHFHQGLDFSTKGKENLPIKSIDSGYIYRIKISSKGYGKAIYIHHPSGLLSVYAHLNQFSNKIQSALDAYLIKHQINEIDIRLKKDSIKVSKNEIIGYSGNTGASTGPHLHFEIRDELTEIPINPIFYLPVQDITPPTIQKIIFYDLSDTLHPTPIFTKNKKTTRVIIVPSITGIAFLGYDKTFPKGNPNNIYKVQIFLDNIKIYQHRLHHITFDNTIYVEYFVDKIDNQYFQKCFASHLYPPFFYDTLVNKGRIILTDTNTHTLKISFCDENKNCTDTLLYIKTLKINPYKKIKSDHLLICTQPISIKNSYFKLDIPEKSLFQHINASFYFNPQKNQISFTHSPLPLKYPAKLTIYHNYPIHDLKNILLSTNHKYFTPDTFDSQKIIFSVNELNTYHLYIDKQSPTIIPLEYNAKKKAIIIPSTQQKIYFKLSDNTAIQDYKVFLNSQFCLAYYYSSKKLLEVQLPKEYLSADQYTLQIIASDIAHNTTIQSYPILFK